MLKGSFYTILEFHEAAPTTIRATIGLNRSHSIFDGHFPAMPVVPGVCMLQIIKECLEEVLEADIRLTKANNIKFLTVLSPMEHEIVEVRINFESSNDGILVSEATILSGATRFIKMQQISYAKLAKRYPVASTPL